MSCPEFSSDYKDEHVPTADYQILELAFRKALADKFYLASPQRKLTLDAEFVTAALNKYVQQVTDGWTDRGFTRHAE